jgi:hypothetical protein
MRSRAQLAAENLFLRKQLALYQERRAKPRRADDATRVVLAGLSRLLEWRQLLVIVKPETLIRWHRKGFRLFWRWKSRAPGRPAIPVELQQLIVTMAAVESHVGRGTHRQRTSGEAWDPGVAAHRAAVHAVATTAEAAHSRLERIRAKPRPMCACE